MGPSQHSTPGLGVSIFPGSVSISSPTISGSKLTWQRLQRANLRILGNGGRRDQWGRWAPFSLQCLSREQHQAAGSHLATLREKASPRMKFRGKVAGWRGKKNMSLAPHSSTVAWKIPWMEEPGRLQSMGLLGVGHNWATSLSLVTFMHWRRKWQPTPVFLPGKSQGQGSLVGCISGVAQSQTRLKWRSSSSSSNDIVGISGPS